MQGQAPNKEQAKRVILEIVRQSEGGLGKTKLFKAFWLAHLYYFKNAASYLTDWPVVRMPKGPGIDQGGRLIRELVESGNLTATAEPRGPFTEIACRITGKHIEGELSDAAVSAIKQAVNDLRRYSAEEISELSHDFSRSWNTKPDGVELDIYTDLIPDEEYQERVEELASMKKDYEKLLE
jgi:hypothetical protein